MTSVYDSERLAAGYAFVTGSAEGLPFAVRSFDLVAAAGSLNYADLPSALAEVARVLTREGTGDGELTVAFRGYLATLTPMQA
jgi:ubiquinone/menaquinone biosynthesis C-methylase UbiE